MTWGASMGSFDVCTTGATLHLPPQGRGCMSSQDFLLKRLHTRCCDTVRKTSWSWHLWSFKKRQTAR
eukprot:795263-Amphidinium_carterae.1